MKKWMPLVAVLVAGILIGHFLSRPPEEGIQEAGTQKEEFRWKGFFGEEKGISSSGEMVLGDFETEKDLEKWQAKGVSAFLSDEHAVRGKHSVKLAYSADDVPRFVLEHFFQKNRQAGNWRGYETLTFTAYNTSPSQERIILQVKDGQEHRYKESLQLPPGRSMTYTISLQDIATFVDLKEIVQVNFFRWKPRKPIVFFLDDVRLIPKGKEAKKTETRPVSEKEASPKDWTLTKKGDIFDGTIHANAPNAVSGLLFKEIASKWEVTSNVTGKTFFKIPVTIARENNLFLPDGLPVTGGIPFPYGFLKEVKGLQLRTADRDELPIQVRPLAFWEDGSIKWLLVHTQLLQNAYDKRLFLEVHPSSGPSPALEVERPLKVEQDDASVTVNTGVLKFSVSKNRFKLFEDVYLDTNGDSLFSEDELVSKGGDLLLRHAGSIYRSSLDKETYDLRVEEEGPLRTTLKASGWFQNKQGQKFCLYQVRLQAFSGRSDIRMAHTFIYTGYPANLYHHEYEGKTLPENETLEEVAIEYDFLSEEDLIYQVGLPKSVLTGEIQKPLLLSQKGHDSFQLFQGKATLHEGEKASGWVHAAASSKGISVGIRDFYQQYPKEIQVDPSGKITLSLWPASSGRLSFETEAAAYGPDAVARGSAFGLAKTHEVLFSFHPGRMQPEALHAFYRAHQGLPVLHADPEWLYASYALGSLGPARSGQEGEELIGLLLDWAQRQPKHFGWYGMLDYGDTRVWYRKDAYDKSYSEWGWHPEGRWGWFNCEQVGSHAAALLQFARTGDYPYFAFGEAASRHIMDVDTIHYDTVQNDPRLKGKIIGDHSKVGSMHRHNANHWGGRSDEASHTHVLGFLLHYYLTGYERAFDVAKEVGSFYLTGPITYTRHPDIAPQRSIANTLWGTTLLYEATHEARYKSAADQWAGLLVEGQEEDGSWRYNFNPRTGEWFDKPNSRWAGFHTLPALIAYHRLTGNPRVKEAILKGTDFLIQHEKYIPFFDALAYSYELTGQSKYLEEARRRLLQQIKAQDQSEETLRRGMVFGKLNYERVPPLLYTVPYLLGVRNPSVLAPFEKRREKADALSEREAIKQETTGELSAYEVFVASPFQRVLKNSPLENFANVNPIRLSLAANEYESGQIVLYSREEDLKEVRLRVEDLVDPETGKRIEKIDVALYVVGYVSLRKSEIFRDLVGPVPDPLPEKEAFDVKKGEPQPIWLTLYVPSGTPPGLYQGAIVIQPKNGPEKRVALEAKVWDFELPKRSRLKTAFDLYQGRLTSGYQDYFPAWWERWKDSLQTLEDRFYERMLAYRISPILNIDPSKPDEIDRVKRLLSRGMTSFGVGKYSGSAGNNWPQDVSSVIPLYREYGQYLRDYGLLHEAYLYTFDEPKPGNARVARITEAVHEADPSLRNLVVLQESPNYDLQADWFKDIDIVCLRNVTFDPHEAENLRDAGKELWIYASGPSFPYPTFVIDYPTMAYRILPWMCWKYRATGLLYWCVNFWTKNPYLDAMNTKWEQNGNGSLFYPGPDGPVGSIRLEILRDGIEDYDMMAILADRIKDAKEKGTVQDSVIQEAEEALIEVEGLVSSMRSYPKEPEGLLALRHRVAEAIVALKSESYP